MGNFLGPISAARLLMCVLAPATVAHAQPIWFDFESGQIPEALQLEPETVWRIDGSQAAGGSSSLSAELTTDPGATATLMIHPSEPYRLDFMFKVAGSWSEFEFRRNHVGQTYLGSVPWSERRMLLRPGQHMLQWIFRQGDGPTDSLWLDDVRAVPALEGDSTVALQETHGYGAPGMVVGKALAFCDLDADGKDEAIAVARRGSGRFLFTGHLRPEGFVPDTIRPVGGSRTFDVSRVGEKCMGVLGDPSGGLEIVELPGLHPAQMPRLPDSRPILSARFADVHPAAGTELVVLSGREGTCYPPGCPSGAIHVLGAEGTSVLWKRELPASALEMVFADAGADALLDVIVGEAPTIALHGETGELLWEEPGGLGTSITAGRFVPGPPALAVVRDSSVIVLDARTRSILHERPVPAGRIKIAPVDLGGDGSDEIAVLSGLYVQLEIFSGDLSTLIHVGGRAPRSFTPHGVHSGDTDGDRQPELVVTERATGDQLRSMYAWPLADAVAQAIPAYPPNLLQTALTASDAGHPRELLLARHGSILAVSPVTLEQLWSMDARSGCNHCGPVGGLTLAQLDDDAGEELVVVMKGDGWDFDDLAIVRQFDVRTRQLEREFMIAVNEGQATTGEAVWPGFASPGLLVLGFDNAVLGVDYASGTVRWRGPDLWQHDATRIDLHDVDGDGQPEVVYTATDVGVAVLDAASGALEFGPIGSVQSFKVLSDGRIAALHAGGDFEVYDRSSGTSQVYEGLSSRGFNTSLWSVSLGGRTVFGSLSPQFEAFAVDSGERMAALGARPMDASLHVLEQDLDRAVLLGASAVGVHRLVVRLQPRALFRSSFEREEIAPVLVTP